MRKSGRSRGGDAALAGVKAEAEVERKRFEVVHTKASSVRCCAGRQAKQGRSDPFVRLQRTCVT